MKSVPFDPATFDGAKFAARYGLAWNDFYASGGRLYYPDALPDMPVLDAPSPPVMTPIQRLRDKRRAGLPLTPIEQQELLDILLGL